MSKTPRASATFRAARRNAGNMPPIAPTHLMQRPPVRPNARDRSEAAETRATTAQRIREALVATARGLARRFAPVPRAGERVNAAQRLVDSYGAQFPDRVGADWPFRPKGTPARLHMLTKERKAELRASRDAAYLANFARIAFNERARLALRRGLEARAAA